MNKLLPAVAVYLLCGAPAAPLRAGDPAAPVPTWLTTGEMSLALQPTVFDDPDYRVPVTQSSILQLPPSSRLTLDAVPATAPEEASSQAELAKKLQNPVADLITVPFQYNADFGIGPHNASRSTLNIQPVVPITLTKDWNLIVRTILPVIYAASPADGVSSEWGLGDTTQTFFFSPKEPIGGWILGAGPVALWPSATDTALGSGKWGAGPSIVALRQEHGWTYGILANHLWSYAGDDDRPSVNATFLQPFLSYTFPTYTTLTLNTESTYDWSSNQWIVPINAMVSQLLKIDKHPVQFQFGTRYYAEGPSGGPEWGIRFAIILLFPK